MKKPREIEKIEQIKELILDTALDVIVKEGYVNLTMRKLASSLNMTAPNIYNYYKSKDEIYISLMVRGFNMLNSTLKNIIDVCDEAPERARRLAKAYILFGINNSSYYNIMFTYPNPQYNDFIGTALEKISELEYRQSMEIVDFLLREIASFSGRNKNDASVHLDLIGIWSMLHGIISLYNSHIIVYTSRNPEEIYSSLIDSFLQKLNIK